MDHRERARARYFDLWKQLMKEAEEAGFDGRGAQREAERRMQIPDGLVANLRKELRGLREGTTINLNALACAAEGVGISYDYFFAASARKRPHYRDYLVRNPSRPPPPRYPALGEYFATAEAEELSHDDMATMRNLRLVGRVPTLDFYVVLGRHLLQCPKAENGNCGSSGNTGVHQRVPAASASGDDDDEE